MKFTDAFILDYGCGNFTSLRAWLKSQQLPTWLIQSKQDFNQLGESSLLILPGVGHYGRAVSVLQDKDMFDTLRSLKGDIHTLGICLGAQLMFEGSSEAPDLPGLAWMQGECNHLPAHQSPRLGWYSCQATSAASLHKKAFSSLDGCFYFNHCYRMPVISSTSNSLHSMSDNCLSSFLLPCKIMGVQFHPERSQNKGKLFLKQLIKYWEVL